MSKRPEVNPDRVKWENDRSKKKATRKHLLQKLEHEKAILAQDLRWIKRAQETYDRQAIKVNQLEVQISQLAP